MTTILKTWTRYEDNIKVNVNYTGCDSVDWMSVVECTSMKTWRAVGNTLRDVTFPLNFKPLMSTIVDVPHR